VAVPAAVVRRQSTVIVWKWTAAALPGATQVKLNGVARPPTGVTGTMPGLAPWFGMIQWSTTLNATGWPATTPLTVTVTGKIAVKLVVSALIGAKLDVADAAVVVQRVDWQFTGRCHYLYQIVTLQAPRPELPR
jgi:hypothetical protein